MNDKLMLAIKCAEQAAHNSKFEKMGLFRHPWGGTWKEEKDPPSCLNIDMEN